ncbi:DHS-like NAD/FAD-binding domain-containing protein [Hymenopellis radicata]|nr:DHS-like NAD/FAD-binding domain-containing protein [Hymenopellis radicata]
MLEESSQSPQRNEFRQALAEAKHIIVVAGAGLSAASDIPTFRDGGGMWRSLDSTSLATPEAFTANPSLVWQFYHYRRTKALLAHPNAAHDATAKLLIPAYLKKVAQQAKSFHLITQNVDGLSGLAFKATSQKLAGNSAKKVPTPKTSTLEMHGSVFAVQCTECGYSTENRSLAVCPSLAAADASFQNLQDAGTKHRDIPLEELPRCEKCGALARPGVVWFGEKPHHLDAINSLVYEADMILVIGTSSTVRPASTFAYRVKRHGGKVAVFNLEASTQDQQADYVFVGPCETILPSLFPEFD